MDLSWTLAFFCYVIGIFLIGMTFKHALLNNGHNTKESWKDRLEKEHLTHFIRQQPIPKDLFLSIDFSIIPMVKEDECQRLYLDVLAFANRPMVDLKAYTNLELKQRFGPQGLELLGGYEKNYFEFMDICCKYGTILFEKGFILEARQILEQALLYQCDLSKCYLQLIDVYHQLHDMKALDVLKVTAKANMKDSPFLPKVLQKIDSL